MAGSSIGTLFTVTTWGESHGPAIGAVIDGCPAGLKIDLTKIQKEVDKRKSPATSRIATGRKEKDEVEILSGIFANKTTGTPISLIIFNRDIRSQDYANIHDLYRPGHADLTYDLKYGFRDHRGGGRSSGRETASRVAAGAIGKIFLKKVNKTEIFSHTIQTGNIKAKSFKKSEIEKNPLRCADPTVAKKMLDYAEKKRATGKTVGGIIEIIVKNTPIGIGEPVFAKLNAELAKALMSIGAIKGIEIGAGFNVTKMTGTKNNDQLRYDPKKKQINFLSNNAGGILGGISTGQDLIIRLAIKPVPSTAIVQKTISKKMANKEIRVFGRHDSCLMPRIIPVAEAMVAITLSDLYLQQRARAQIF